MTENLYESVVNRPIRRFSVCRGDHWSPALCLMAHNGVIPSEVEESRGNELFLLPCGRVFLLFKFCSARVMDVP